uniref:Portal protein n=1 Tax=Siphoviridae sp. ctTnV63 TaxID=2825523 RepID=A0A8S5NW01_9CAUD|nr:MAG TPA: portal protein [Siphoviridae sp. ctTnV63]
MLETTQYNYKDLSKLYKEQSQLGNSRLLSQIALGQSQSAIINTAYFENQVLNLSDIMIPPMSSNTMSSANIKAAADSSKKTITAAVSADGENKGGRPELDESQKSDKTLANEASQG